MAFSASIETVGEATVVRFAGDVIDPARVALIADDTVSLLASEQTPIVIDVTDLTLASGFGAQALMRTLAVVATHRHVGVVCERLSGRQVMRRFGPSSMMLYASVNDAVRDAALRQSTSPRKSRSRNANCVSSTR